MIRFYINFHRLITKIIFQVLTLIKTMKEQIVYDNYGFKTSPSKKAVESYLSDEQTDKERIMVWEKILNSPIDKISDQEVRLEVRKGIPDKIRPKVWMNLITPPLKQYENIKVIEELKQIDRDIGRTIQTNRRQVQLKGKLKNILNIVAVAFPKMGYCQGLNFITANLLLILDQKQTYNVLFHILHWQDHGKLMSDLDRIHVKLYALNIDLELFTELVKKHYPQLSKHLQKMEIQPLLYASSWFITIFHNILPCQYIFRIMEMYLVEGEKIVYRVALQILKQKKNILKKMNTPEEVIGQLKNYEYFGKSMIGKFFREMFELNLSRKEIQGYEKQYLSLKKQ